MKNEKKLTLIPLALMTVTSVFMFPNVPRAYLLMGYAAIPWYVLAAITFLIPFAFMVGEYGAAFRKEKGGIYSWLERIIGSQYAFVSIFLWYVGWLVWIILTSNSIWVHLSTILFGRDTTTAWSFLGLDATHTLGIMSIFFVMALTFVASRGLDKVSKVTSVGGISVAFINIAAYIGAIIVFVLNHGQIAEPISMTAFLNSPNPDYTSGISIVSFISFAILAYAGIEVVAGVTDNTENAERTFPRGVLLGSLFIGICYSLGIFACGIFTNWHQVLQVKDVNMVNVTIIMMNNLGYQIGQGLGMGIDQCVTMGNWVARVVGLSMFLTYLGALISYSYSPLKQLIEGTPKELWPGKLSVVEDGVPRNAMWVQCGFICFFILLLSMGGQGASAFFDKLVLMTNVATTIPYIFMSGAFVRFKQNESIEKPFVIFKTKGSAWFWTVVVTFTVVLANVTVVLKPAVTKGDWASSLWMIAGPVLFAVVALAMYHRYQRITEK